MIDKIRIKIEKDDCPIIDTKTDLDKIDNVFSIIKKKLK